MINLINTQKINEVNRAGNRIYKNSLLTRAMTTEWEIKIIKIYGSVKAYKKIQREKTNKFIRDVLC